MRRRETFSIPSLLKSFFFGDLSQFLFYSVLFLLPFGPVALLCNYKKKNKGIRPRAIPASSSQPTAYQKLVDTRKTKESRQIKSEQFSWFLSFWTGRRPRIKDAGPPTEKRPFSVKFTHTRMNGRFFFSLQICCCFVVAVVGHKNNKRTYPKEKESRSRRRPAFFFL